MKYGVLGWLASGIVGLALTATPFVAHHSVLAKFDDSRPMTLEGIVTSVDWKSPHVHVFMNVREGAGWLNWAVELESPDQLVRGGWRRDTLVAGDAITVEGPAARNGSNQVWGNSVVLTGANKRVFHLSPSMPPEPLAPRPAPSWPDGQPALGALPGTADGYWAHPSKTVLIEDGVDVEVAPDGRLANLDDAGRVAPFQPWAEELYKARQSRNLQDDPMYLNCKPPGGPRQFQLPQGVKFVEDRETERVFVLVGSGNRNFHIWFLDGREPVGQVGGDDDNPLYYGRSVGEWDDDTLVVETSSFNEDFWMTNGGLPHTDQLRLTQRISRPDFDTLTYEVTVDDPGAYTRPWTASWTLRWVSGEELPAHFCQENRS